MDPAASRRIAWPWLPLALALVLAIVVSLGTLNPYPARPAPAEHEVQVVAGTRGAESDGTGIFWWIVASPLELRVSNNSPDPVELRVEATLDAGPCALERTVEVPGGTVAVNAGSSARLELTLPLDGYEVELVPIVVAGTPCPPVGGDPRSLLVRLRDLTVRPVT